MKELTQALRDLNEAAYAAIRAGKDIALYPRLDRVTLRDIARMTDIMVETPMKPEEDE